MKKWTLDGMAMVGFSALVLVMFAVSNIAGDQEASLPDISALWQPQTKQTVDGEQVYTWHAGDFDNWVDAEQNSGADPESGPVGIVGTSSKRAVLDGTTSLPHNLYVGVNPDRKGMGYGGDGELEITSSGELKLPEDHKRFIIGNRGGAGTVHQNGGTVRQNYYANGIFIGRGAQGIYNLNGGTLRALEHVYVGAAGDHNSQLNVRGGTFSGDDNMNVYVGVGHGSNDATGTFHVQGSGSDRIIVGKEGTGDGTWIQDEGGTLKLSVDEGGVTPIEVRNDVTFRDGATLNVQFREDSERIGSWDVMTWRGTITKNALRFADAVNDDLWNMEFVDTNDDDAADTLRLNAVPNRADRIASLNDLSGEVPDHAVQSLITVLDADNPDDRRSALERLNEMEADVAPALSAPEAEPVVEFMLKYGNFLDSSMDLLLAGGVANQAVPGLIDMLKSKDPKVQLEALNALKKIGPDAADAVRPVAEILDRRSLRREAASTLTALGPSAAPVLVDALQDAEALHLRLTLLNAVRTAGTDLRTALAENKEAVQLISHLARPQVQKPIRHLATKALRGMNREQARVSLGDLSTLEHWSGVEKAVGAGPDGGDAVRLTSSDKATFRYGEEDGEKTGDWADWPVLAFDVKGSGDTDAADLTVSLKGSSEDVTQPVELTVSGADWETVYLPVNKFREHGNVPRHRLLNHVRGLDFTTDTSGDLLLAEPRLQRGRKIGLMFPRQSKAGELGETLTYDGTVVNSSDQPQTVKVRLDRQGAAVMPTTVTPRKVQLAPGESRDITVRADIPTPETPGVQGELPQGARERWSVEAVPGTDLSLSETSELIHLVEVKSPYLIHTEKEWEEIRELVETQDWAQSKIDGKIDWAQRWEPEEANPLDAKVAYGGQKNQLTNAVIVYHITQDRAIGKKLAEFMRTFADPVTGFPAVGQFVGGARTIRHGNHLRAFAKAYAAIRNTDLLSEQDRKNIEQAFRLTMDFPSTKSPPGNQPLQSVTGGLFAALAIQDWDRVNYFMEGPGKLFWHIRRGIMDDGWWVEMSTGYNILSAKLLTKAGLALRPWGVDALTRKFSAVYHENYRAWADPGEDISARFYRDSGIFTSVWGPSRRTYRRIRDLWDATLPLMNEEGRVPGLNDSGAESSISTNALYLAAYAFDDPTYLRNTEEHNLLYPVELPDEQKSTNELLPSSSAHNAGVDLLRSQGVESPHQQYQTLLSYGSHGGFHGHWDRLNVGWMRRFGRIIMQSPKTWYRYDTPMYQFGMSQTSISHNMLIVDGKNQYPAASHPITFHAGELFQASAVENKTKWSNPRYGGHYQDGNKWYNEEKDILKFSVRGGGPTLTAPVPDDHPEWGHMNDYTEPVRSRRLLATTDEYVLVVDHVRADSKHTYDVVYNLPNFKGLGGSGDITLSETREQFDDSPLRPGQFITNARFHKADGNVRAHFKPGYPKSSETSGDDQPRPIVPENGVSLSVDVHTVWPPERKQVVGDNPPISGSPDHMGWTFYSAGRKTARQASFVTLIEVQKDKSDRQIKHIEADGPGQITVTLADGRTHTWRIDGLGAKKDRPSSISIELVEKSKDGDVLDREQVK